VSPDQGSEQPAGRDALAVYGSLAPGETNHWVISRIEGDWEPGTIRGYTFEITWGPAEGHQGFIPDSGGVEVAVAVLRSASLDKQWRDVDEFEGPGYERTRLAVTLESGEEIEAWIYVALTDA